jgi:biotin carboxyl carrier protein
MTPASSEVTGIVCLVQASVGQVVAEGDTLVVIESMKMEIPVCAPCSGTVRELFVAVGEAVAEGDTVAVVG